MRYLQNIFLTCLFLLGIFYSEAQIVGDNFTRPAYGYRSAENPYYWKNKKPFDGYWQQDVQYQIKANIDETTDIIDADLVLTYFNNSPDDLPFVYFHVYQEIFQPGSYLDELNRANDIKPAFGKYEQQGKGTDVEKITIVKLNGNTINKEATITQDFSVIKVDLPQPLKSGSSVTFQIPFKSYFDNGGLRRRMKKYPSGEFTHYNGVHWYPRICVYDRKFGWDTDQHLGKEFYGDYGTFEIALTFASNYIVEGTGYLENEAEVLPKSLREKLDIRNFAVKPWEEPASVIIPYIAGEKKTWKYYAINVHDFAFTADPSYRIGEAMAMVNGKPVKCIALAQEQHAGLWQNAAMYTKQIIETFSEDFSDYIWPKIIVADARDGMEYPMLTLDGGYDPSYRDLFIHEVGHMWFFGMVGNNETYRASLDEGFTQFLTAWGYRKIDGDYRIDYKEQNNYKAKFRDPDEIIMSEVYYAYLDDAARQLDMPLNTHSDMFNSALNHGGGYRHVYFKTAVMLYNLQYVLGDDLFLAAMKNYTQQWKLCHPYFEDFRNSIIQYTHVDLNWFFDQWLETTKNIDYGIKDVKKIKREMVYKPEGSEDYAIIFKRNGQMQMPIDFIVTLENGDTLKYYIPNNWYNKYEKNAGLTNPKVIILPKWYGWDKLNEEYVAQITTSKKIKDVIIDPSNRLADINKLDNSWKCPVTWEFDSKISNYKDWKHYEMRFRPDIWWNAYDGVKAGWNFNGDYFGYKHKLELTVWYNTGLGQGLLYDPVFVEQLGEENIDISDDYDLLNFDFNYRTATDRILSNSDFILDVKYLEGVFGFKTGFEKKLGNGLRNKLSLYVKDMYFNKTEYLYNGDLINKLKNNTVNIEYEHNYNYYTGSGKIQFGFRSNELYSDYDFSRLNIETINKTRLGKFDLRTRYFIQAGTGSDVPFESALMLAGANSEELLDNKYTRSRGFFPDEWADFGETTNHFHAGGGLNLRGYAGYLAPELNDVDGIDYMYYGTSGTSVSAELQFNRLFNFKLIKFIKMEPYIFGDAGFIANQDLKNISDLRADAGIGSAFTWSWFGPLETVKPITVRIDLPLFLNRPPFEEVDYFQLRYVVGINRAF
ncbi:MAG: M1 family aminopeptidase [Chitinophagales bacterium]